MFKKNKKLVEEFEVGTANMEVPNYEIKINGAVPLDYAKAINDRKNTVKKIKDDFVQKDKLTDEFIEEQDDRRMNESFDSKLYDEAVVLSKTLDSFITKIGSFVDTDFAMADSDMDTLNRAVEALDTFATLYFEEKYPLRESSKAEQIRKQYKELEAKLKSEGKDIEKEKLNGPLHDLAMKYVDATIGIKESKEALYDTNKSYWYFTTHGVQPGSIPKGVKVLDLIDTYNGTYVLLDRVLSTKELYNFDLKERSPIDLQESEEVEQPVKRRGRPKADPKDKMFSDGDLWLQVYDDLSSEVDNEGKGKEVNKQVKIPRGKRFIGPYAGPGDYDLTVYGKNMEDLQWAKKVADHYGVDIEIKKDNNSNTNSYYPYVAILKDVR